MSNKHENNQESQATARIALGTTKKDAVGKLRDTVSAVKANPEYPTKPEVQQVTTVLIAATDALDNNIKSLAAIRTEEKSLLTTQIVLHAAVKRSVKSMLAVITETAAGSADGIKKWGFDVTGRVASTPTTAAPGGLRATYRKNLTLVVRWNGVLRGKGYEVQIGDGNGQGWGQPIHLNHPSFVPTGFTPGQKVSFRVAVHRTTGLSEYSDPLIITVR